MTGINKRPDFIRRDPFYKNDSIKGDTEKSNGKENPKEEINEKAIVKNNTEQGRVIPEELTQEQAEALAFQVTGYSRGHIVHHEEPAEETPAEETTDGTETTEVQAVDSNVSEGARGSDGFSDIGTKTEYSKEELIDEGITSEYWIEKYFDKVGDNYALKQNLTVEGNSINSIADLRNTLNLLSFEEYLDKEFSNEAGSLWNEFKRHGYDANYVNSGNGYAFGFDEPKNVFYHNLAINLGSASGGYQFGFDHSGGQATNSGWLTLEPLATALINGGYVTKKDNEDYTVEELKTAVDRYMTDLAQKCGKSVEDLSFQDFIKECCDTQPKVKEDIQDCQIRHNIDASLAFNILGNGETDCRELFQQLVGYGRYGYGISVNEYDPGIIVQRMLSDFIYDLEPMPSETDIGRTGYFLIKDALFRAAGIDEDSMSVDEKASKMRAYLYNIEEERGKYNTLNVYDLFDYMINHGELEEPSYTSNELKSIYNLTDEEIDKFYYLENGKYKAKHNPENVSDHDKDVFEKKLRSSFHGADPYGYYVINYAENGLYVSYEEDNDYNTWLSEHGYDAATQDFKALEDFILETQPNSIRAEYIRRTRKTETEYSDFRDALFETILTNFDNFDINNESGSPKLDDLGNNEAITKAFFDAHAEELQRLSKEDQDALVEKCLKKLTNNSRKIVLEPWIRSLVTAMGGNVINQRDGYYDESTHFCKMGLLEFKLNDNIYRLYFEPVDGLTEPVHLDEQVYDEYIQFLHNKGYSEDEIQDILSVNNLERNNENNVDRLLMADTITPEFLDFLKEKYNITESEIQALLSPLTTITNSDGEVQVLQYSLPNIYAGEHAYNYLGSVIYSLQDLIYFLNNRDEDTQVQNRIVTDSRFESAIKKANDELNGHCSFSCIGTGIYINVPENGHERAPEAAVSYIYVWDNQSGELINTGVPYGENLNPNDFADENVRNLVEYYLSLPPQGNPNTIHETAVDEPTDSTETNETADSRNVELEEEVPATEEPAETDEVASGRHNVQGNYGVDVNNLIISTTTDEEGSYVVYQVSSAAELLATMQKASARDEIMLDADIDISDIDWQTIETFSGTIVGNGHTIKGISKTEGFINNAINAKFNNLMIEDNATPDNLDLFILNNNGSQFKDCSVRLTNAANAKKVMQAKAQQLGYTQVQGHSAIYQDSDGNKYVWMNNRFENIELFADSYTHTENGSVDLFSAALDNGYSIVGFTKYGNCGYYGMKNGEYYHLSLDDDRPNTYVDSNGKTQWKQKLVAEKVSYEQVYEAVNLQGTNYVPLHSVVNVKQTSLDYPPEGARPTSVPGVYYAFFDENGQVIDDINDVPWNATMFAYVWDSQKQEYDMQYIQMNRHVRNCYDGYHWDHERGHYVEDATGREIDVRDFSVKPDTGGVWRELSPEEYIKLLNGEYIYNPTEYDRHYGPTGGSYGWSPEIFSPDTEFTQSYFAQKYGYNATDIPDVYEKDGKLYKFNQRGATLNYHIGGDYSGESCLGRDPFVLLLDQDYMSVQGPQEASVFSYEVDIPSTYGISTVEPPQNPTYEEFMQMLVLSNFLNIDFESLVEEYDYWDMNVSNHEFKHRPLSGYEYVGEPFDLGLDNIKDYIPGMSQYEITKDNYQAFVSKMQWFNLDELKDAVMEQLLDYSHTLYCYEANSNQPFQWVEQLASALGGSVSGENIALPRQGQGENYHGFTSPAYLDMMIGEDVYRIGFGVHDNINKIMPHEAICSVEQYQYLVENDVPQEVLDLFFRPFNYKNGEPISYLFTFCDSMNDNNEFGYTALNGGGLQLLYEMTNHHYYPGQDIQTYDQLLEALGIEQPSPEQLGGEKIKRVASQTNNEVPADEQTDETPAGGDDNYYISQWEDLYAELLNYLNLSSENLLNQRTVYGNLNSPYGSLENMRAHCEVMNRANVLKVQQNIDFGDDKLNNLISKLISGNLTDEEMQELNSIISSHYESRQPIIVRNLLGGIYSQMKRSDLEAIAQKLCTGKYNTPIEEELAKELLSGEITDNNLIQSAISYLLDETSEKRLPRGFNQQDLQAKVDEYMAKLEWQKDFNNKISMMFANRLEKTISGQQESANTTNVPTDASNYVESDTPTNAFMRTITQEEYQFLMSCSDESQLEGYFVRYDYFDNNGIRHQGFRKATLEDRGNNIYHIESTENAVFDDTIITAPHVKKCYYVQVEDATSITTKDDITINCPDYLKHRLYYLGGEGNPSETEKYGCFGYAGIDTMIQDLRSLKDEFKNKLALDIDDKTFDELFERAIKITISNINWDYIDTNFNGESPCINFEKVVKSLSEQINEMKSESNLGKKDFIFGEKFDEGGIALEIENKIYQVKDSRDEWFKRTQIFNDLMQYSDQMKSCFNHIYEFGELSHYGSFDNTFNECVVEVVNNLDLLSPISLESVLGKLEDAIKEYLDKQYEQLHSGSPYAYSREFDKINGPFGEMTVGEYLYQYNCEFEKYQQAFSNQEISSTEVTAQANKVADSRTGGVDEEVPAEEPAEETPTVGATSETDKVTGGRLNVQSTYGISTVEPPQNPSYEEFMQMLVLSNFLNIDFESLVEEYDYWDMYVSNPEFSHRPLSGDEYVAKPFDFGLDNMGQYKITKDNYQAFVSKMQWFNLDELKDAVMEQLLDYSHTLYCYEANSNQPFQWVEQLASALGGSLSVELDLPKGGQGENYHGFTSPAYLDMMIGEDVYRIGFGVHDNINKVMPHEAICSIEQYQYLVENDVPQEVLDLFFRPFNYKNGEPISYLFTFCDSMNNNEFALNALNNGGLQLLYEMTNHHYYPGQDIQTYDQLLEALGIEQPSPEQLGGEKIKRVKSQANNGVPAGESKGKYGAGFRTYPASQSLDAYNYTSNFTSFNNAHLLNIGGYNIPFANVFDLDYSSSLYIYNNIFTDEQRALADRYFDDLYAKQRNSRAKEAIHDSAITMVFNKLSLEQMRAINQSQECSYAFDLSYDAIQRYESLKDIEDDQFINNKMGMLYSVKTLSKALSMGLIPNGEQWYEGLLNQFKSRCKDSAELGSWTNNLYGISSMSLTYPGYNVNVVGDNIEFTQTSIKVIKEFLNSLKNREPNETEQRYLDMFGFTVNDNETAIAEKISAFCRSHGSTDGRTMSLESYYNAIAEVQNSNEMLTRECCENLFNSLFEIANDQLDFYQNGYLDTMGMYANTVDYKIDKNGNYIGAEWNSPKHFSGTVDERKARLQSAIEKNRATYNPEDFMDLPIYMVDIMADGTVNFNNKFKKALKTYLEKLCNISVRSADYIWQDSYNLDLSDFDSYDFDLFLHYCGLSKNDLKFDSIVWTYVDRQNNDPYSNNHTDNQAMIISEEMFDAISDAIINKLGAKDGMSFDEYYEMLVEQGLTSSESLGYRVNNYFGFDYVVSKEEYTASQIGATRHNAPQNNNVGTSSNKPVETDGINQSTPESNYDSSIKVERYNEFAVFNEYMSVNSADGVVATMPAESQEVYDYIQSLIKPIFEEFYQADHGSFSYMKYFTDGFSPNYEVLDDTYGVECKWKSEEAKQACFEAFQALVPQILEKYGDILTSLIYNGETFVFSTIYDNFECGNNHGHRVGLPADKGNMSKYHWVPLEQERTVDKPVSYINVEVIENNIPDKLPVDPAGKTVVRTAWDGICVSTDHTTLYVWDSKNQKYVAFPCYSDVEALQSGNIDALPWGRKFHNTAMDNNTINSMFISLINGFSRTSVDNIFVDKDGKYYMLDDDRLGMADHNFTNPYCFVEIEINSSAVAKMSAPSRNTGIPNEQISVVPVFEDEQTTIAWLKSSANVFLWDYFNLDLPMNWGKLSNSQLQYVNDHPEIFHMHIENNVTHYSINYDDYIMEYPYGQGDNHYTYESGTYDMFGNGSPLGPDGSIPTGIDGIFVKQIKDDNGDDAIKVYYYNPQTNTYDTVIHRSDMLASNLACALKRGNLYYINPRSQDDRANDLMTTFSFCTQEEQEYYYSAYLGYQKTSEKGVYYKDGKFYTFKDEYSYPIYNIEQYESNLFKETTVSNPQDIKIYQTQKSIDNKPLSATELTSELNQFGAELNLKPIGNCSDISYDEYLSMMNMIEFLMVDEQLWDKYQNLNEPYSWFAISLAGSIPEQSFNELRNELPQFDKAELTNLVLQKLMASPYLPGSGNNTIYDINPSLEKLLDSMGAEVTKFEPGRHSARSCQIAFPTYVSFELNGNSYKICLTPTGCYSYPKEAIVTKEQVESLRNYVDETVYQNILDYYFTPANSINGEVQNYIITYCEDFFRDVVHTNLEGKDSLCIIPRSEFLDEDDYKDYENWNHCDLNFNDLLQYVMTHNLKTTETNETAGSRNVELEEEVPAEEPADETPTVGATSETNEVAEARNAEFEEETVDSDLDSLFNESLEIFVNELRGNGVQNGYKLAISPYYMDLPIIVNNDGNIDTNSLIAYMLKYVKQALPKNQTNSVLNREQSFDFINSLAVALDLSNNDNELTIRNKINSYFRANGGFEQNGNYTMDLKTLISALYKDEKCPVFKSGFDTKINYDKAIKTSGLSDFAFNLEDIPCYISDIYSYIDGSLKDDDSIWNVGNNWNNFGSLIKNYKKAFDSILKAAGINDNDSIEVKKQKVKKLYDSLELSDTGLNTADGYKLYTYLLENGFVGEKEETVEVDAVDYWKYLKAFDSNVLDILESNQVDIEALIKAHPDDLGRLEELSIGLSLVFNDGTFVTIGYENYDGSFGLLHCKNKGEFLLECASRRNDLPDDYYNYVVSMYPELAEAFNNGNPFVKLSQNQYKLPTGNIMRNLGNGIYKDSTVSRSPLYIWTGAEYMEIPDDLFDKNGNITDAYLKGEKADYYAKLEEEQKVINGGYKKLETSGLYYKDGKIYAYCIESHEMYVVKENGKDYVVEYYRTGISYDKDGGTAGYTHVTFRGKDYYIPPMPENWQPGETQTEEPAEETNESKPTEDTPEKDAKSKIIDIINSKKSAGDKPKIKTVTKNPVSKPGEEPTVKQLEPEETETPAGARTVDFEEDETTIPETDKTEESDSVEESTEVKPDIESDVEILAEPEVLVDINTYEKQSEKEALKLGLSFDRKTRSFYKFQNGMRYNYIWNPYKNNEKGGFEIYVAGQVKPTQDKKTVLLQMILAARNQNLNFTTILGICRDSDGNYYDYNEKQKIYVRR